MKWDKFKLKKLLNVFGITQFELADYLKIERSRISHMINEEEFNFDKYGQILSAYFESKRQGRIKEHQTMIRFYESVL